MLLEPRGREVICSMAVSQPVRVTMPRTVAPFLKVTVPEGVCACDDTLAVKVTSWPKTEGVGAVTRQVEVGAWVTD